MPNENNNELISSLRKIAKSSTGKNAFLFLIFLIVASIFWLMLALNDEIQKDYVLPLDITEVPDSITLIDNIPDKINVSVRDKGSSLVRFSLGNNPSIKVKYKDVQYVNGRIILSRSNINSILQSKFGSNAQIVSFTPDSIKSAITNLPGKSVKLIINANIKPNPQYVICGNITANVDSIKLFSQNPIPDSIIAVNTALISRDNVTDTIKEQVTLILPNNIKAKPNKVTVTIPVEPLISKKVSINIQSESTDGSKLIVFPSKCEVSYLIPMSRYNELPKDIVLKATYKASKSTSNKIPVTVSCDSVYYQNISVKPDSVEYIIEQ
ncbi:MAG: hypothetical protein IKZ14_02655 [Muribaculaceae bacterium]|nr:hypothetical protein [Muribaculaceae bacterium]